MEYKKKELLLARRSTSHCTNEVVGRPARSTEVTSTETLDKDGVLTTLSAALQHDVDIKCEENVNNDHMKGLGVTQESR